MFDLEARQVSWCVMMGGKKNPLPKKEKILKAFSIFSRLVPGMTLTSGWGERPFPIAWSVVKCGPCTLGYSRRTTRAACGCHAHAVMLRWPDIEPCSLEQRAKHLATGVDQLAASEEGNTVILVSQGFRKEKNKQKKCYWSYKTLDYWKILLIGNI